MEAIAAVDPGRLAHAFGQTTARRLNPGPSATSRSRAAQGGPPPVPPVELQAVLVDVAARGDAALFQDLARCLDVREADRERLWGWASSRAGRVRRSPLENGPRDWSPDPFGLWRDLLEPAAPLPWRERASRALLWVVGLVLAGLPLVYLAMTLRDFLTLLPLGQ